MESGWKSNNHNNNNNNNGNCIETTVLSPSCPRCGSSNTKFCYYNNYSLTQPRYFCKGCRRYWTKGGSLRNVPVGGGCRKTRRPPRSLRLSATSPSGSALNDRNGHHFYGVGGNESDAQGGGVGGGPPNIDLAIVYASYLNQKPDPESDSGPPPPKWQPGCDSPECFDLSSTNSEPNLSPGMFESSRMLLEHCGEAPSSEESNRILRDCSAVLGGAGESRRRYYCDQLGMEGEHEKYGLPPLPGDGDHEMLWSNLPSDNVVQVAPLQGIDEQVAYHHHHHQHHEESNLLGGGNWSPFEMSTTKAPSSWAWEGLK